MTRTRDINAALRSLDVADLYVDLAANARARADLQNILATEPAPNPHQHPGSPRSMGVPGRGACADSPRVTVGGGVLTAVTAGVLGLPSHTGGDQAFVSWTSAPHGISVQQSADAANNCHEAEKDAGGIRFADELRRSEPAVVERRGMWTMVVLTGPGGFSAMCLTDDSSHMFNRDMIGSIGKPVDYVVPGPRELTAADPGVGTMNAGNLSIAAGTAGSDVIAVAYHDDTRGEVAATVSNGRFALWIPVTNSRPRRAVSKLK